MAKAKKQIPIVKYLYNGDPNKAREVLGEIVVEHAGGSPSKIPLSDLFLNEEAFERAVQRNYHDPVWLIALYQGWRERLGDTLTLRDRLSKLRHLEARTQALQVYNQFLKVWEEAEKNRIAVETTIKTAALQEKVAIAKWEADLAAEEARKAENERKAKEARKEPASSRKEEREEEKEELQHELDTTELRTKIEKAKGQEQPDPVEAHRQQKAVETAKKKIDMEEAQKIREAAIETTRQFQETIEKELGVLRKNFYPEAWETEGEWLENLQKKKEILDYVDVIIERYEKERKRLYDSVEKKRGDT